MHLTLEVKRYHEFFWLRDIQAVNIYKCCAECFIGNRDSRVYHGTLHQPHALIDIDVKENPKAVAYYLCGLSGGVQLPPEHTRGVHSRSGRDGVRGQRQYPADDYGRQAG